MSLLTELEESKGSVSYKPCAPSGAGGISRLPIQDKSSTQVHNLGKKPPEGCVTGQWLDRSSSSQI